MGPSAEDLANANLAQVKLLLKSESRELAINWVDTFPSETGYRIERQLAAGGDWQLQEALPSAPGTDTPYQWSRIIDQSATYRVVAQRDGYVVPLKSEESVTDVPVDLTAAALMLLVEETDPLHGIVHLSVQGAQSARSVQYFVDLNSIVTSSVGPQFPATWDTRAVPDGNHLVLAHVAQRPGLRVELRRSVVVDNPNVAVAVFASGMDDRILSGIATVWATATSDVGIHSVEFFLNDTSLGVGTISGSSWTQRVDTRSMPFGHATLRAVATDNAGHQGEATRRVLIDNPPVLMLEEPVDGAIVSGTLEVRGSASDDRPSSVVTISLGDVQILQSPQGSFATNYSLSGLPGGQYTLTVTVGEPGRSGWRQQQAVVVVPSPAFSYERVGTFDARTSLLDTASGTLLYRAATDRTIRMLHPDSSEVVLEGSAEISPPDFVDSRASAPWQLRDSRVTTFGKLTSVGPAKAFLFDASGRREEVPYDNGTDRYDSFLRSGLHASWLVSGNDRIYIRNLASQAPAQGPIAGNLVYGHAFVTTAGSEALFYTRDVGPMQGPSLTELFCYRLADQSISQVTTGGGRHPKADAARVVWDKATATQNVFELWAAPVDNPTASSVLSTQMVSFDLNDGLLAWVENANNALALRVDDSDGTLTISSMTSTALYSTSNGHVIFGENGKLYAWSRAQGKRLLLETLPAQVIQRDGVAFLVTGTSSVTIYRVAL